MPAARASANTATRRTTPGFEADRARRRIDGRGRPICSELWPGNTTDVTTLLSVTERLKTRFLIARIGVVADRGMISAATLAELELNATHHLNPRGTRTRDQGNPRCDRRSRPLCAALDRQGGQPRQHRSCGQGSGPHRRRRRWQAVGAAAISFAATKPRRNRDKAEREAILAALEAALRRGALDALFDGTYVLCTNIRITPLQAALRYRERWMVEDISHTAPCGACIGPGGGTRGPLAGGVGAPHRAAAGVRAVVERDRPPERDRDRAAQKALYPAQCRSRLRRHCAQNPAVALPPLIRCAQPPPRQKPRRQPRRRSAQRSNCALRRPDIKGLSRVRRRGSI